ncbi:MAG: NUDIX domain-containing protein [Candidatus Abawacabacteria bacterium]|nr:NUDIX domain-containing protein [Candidatus Abawacabacteria bacterium]
MPTNNYLHEVAITAIIINEEGKYLITKRAMSKKRFPGMWTVPGGKLEAKDYLELPKDTEFYWYNVLERVLKREVQEEVGLEIKDVEYLTSLATVHADGSPSIVISCTAQYVGGTVKLQPEETDEYAWVSTEEAKKYPLIDGIYEELVMIDKKRRGEKNVLWEHVNK